ncbi:DUF3098 domain-containing protein [Mangrovibacterium diazotrophicum]|uniref:DUF3098 family protein n=1 Tax=Mangrovibacterium diazotrophicum TaxID=1261403 RepID=A0A419VXX6_9BACT|nr:DUF3098 domain-containing protein [Mangrovibacterium diazotrophicum]RKD87930.1 Protein of unknown function (DUF3098) [Mangrovibacterium diazotrophicum]
MLFDRKKYIRLISILLLLILGFVLMSGPGKHPANEFDPSIFSFRRITLAPIIVLASYAGIIWLIMHKPKDECSDEK